ncbi:hypothetical protein [Methylobacterium nigriterrae]|uniref:hypothetical protein n=1 Tax=Methylobacterium nigriterrae TaxID=3127512 RepID=UPI003013ECA8
MRVRFQGMSTSFAERYRADIDRAAIYSRGQPLRITLRLPPDAAVADTHPVDRERPVQGSVILDVVRHRHFASGADELVIGPATPADAEKIAEDDRAWHTCAQGG